MPLVTSGVDNGNLRELALKKMKEMNLVCRDVRTREIGIKDVADKISNLPRDASDRPRTPVTLKKLKIERIA